MQFRWRSAILNRCDLRSPRFRYAVGTAQQRKENHLASFGASTINSNKGISYAIVLYEVFPALFQVIMSNDMASVGRDACQEIGLTSRAATARTITVSEASQIGGKKSRGRHSKPGNDENLYIVGTKISADPENVLRKQLLSGSNLGFQSFFRLCTNDWKQFEIISSGKAVLKITGPALSKIIQ